jgi:hypothetical protein
MHADDAARFDDWQEVARVGQVYEAELIALRLSEAGIEAQVLDQSFEQVPLPNVENFEVVRVLVPTEKAEEARRVLSAPSILPEDAEATSGEPEVPVVAGDEPEQE